MRTAIQDLTRKGRWFWVAGLYAALTLLYAWPLLAAIGSHLPSDIGDPGLNTWILWWNAHAVPLTERWWDAPIFFPVRGTFALSETLLGIAPLTTPLQWTGASPIVAYNVAFLFSYFLAALAAHLLALHLTGRHSAALIAGVAYGFNPYRAAQLPHLQMLMSCWMPLGLFSLHRFLETRRRRDLALFGVAWLLNGLTTGYYLMFFAVLVGCWIVWFVRTRRDAFAILLTAIVATLPLLPLLAGYTRRQQELGASRGLGEIVSYSADLSAIWATSPFVWFSHHWTRAPLPEGELYPGAIVLALAVAGVVLVLRDSRQQTIASVTESTPHRVLRRALFTAGALIAGIGVLSLILGGWTGSVAGVAISTTRPYKTFTSAVYLLAIAAVLHPRLAAAWKRRPPALFYGAAACVMFVLALGPIPHAFESPIFYGAPYAWLMALPGGHALRVPARFAMLIALCLSQAGALAFARFNSKGSPLLTSVLVVGIALEGWIPKLKIDPAPTPIDLSGLDRSIPVLELPMGDTFVDTAAMLRQTMHGHPLVNGFSGYLPPHYLELQEAIQQKDAEVFRTLLDRGQLIIVVDPARDADRQLRDFVARTGQTKLIRQTDSGVVYLKTAKEQP